MHDPRTLDLKSLVLHELIVDKVRRNPDLFKCVQRTLDRWQHETRAGKRPYFVKWQSVVNQGMEAALAVAVEDSEYAQTMRQASPFVGILTESERLTFLDRWTKSLHPQRAA